MATKEKNKLGGLALREMPSGTGVHCTSFILRYIPCLSHDKETQNLLGHCMPKIEIQPKELGIAINI